MIATITHTRRPLYVRLLRPLAIWYLRGWIASEERYLEQLRAGGIYSAELIAKRAMNITPIRALLYFWEMA